MNLAEFSVRRPVAASIINIALLVLGLFVVGRMAVSLYPDVSIPFIAVTVPYPGASPEQIESTILKPLEVEMSSLKKLNRTIGKALPNAGVVVLGFKMSADEREAVDAVREKVSLVRAKFPKGVDEPTVQRVDFGATPILIFGVESSLAPEATRKKIDDTLMRAIERVEGVSSAEVLGLGEEQLQFQFDAQKLSALRVSPLEIFQLVSEQLAVVPWGDVTNNNRVMSVARKAFPDSEQYWDNYELTLRDSRGLNLGQVGKTVRASDEHANEVLINGKPGLGLVISKRADANTVDTVNRVHKIIQEYKDSDGIRLFPIIDQAKFINANAHEVWIALFVGGAFAILVILLFLTDIKSALISATALPVSVAGSFLFMYAMGFSINMLTLLALALAIGLLIDDAVVVRESIYRELEEGRTGADAAIHGTQKVASAVLATTLAVIAVFVPVALMGGLVGQFFKQFGFTICIAVTLSLFVAFTLDPMLSARFAGKPSPLQGKAWNAWRDLLLRAESRIKLTAGWAFDKPVRVIALSVLLLVASMALALSRGSEFLAAEDRDQFLVSLKMHAGTTKDQNRAIVVDATSRLEKLPALENVFATIGEGRDQNLSTLRLVFKPKSQRTHSILDLQNEARAKLQDIPADWVVLDPPQVEGVGAEAPLSVYLYGENLTELMALAHKIRDSVAKVPGVASARVDTGDFGKAFDLELRNIDLGFFGTSSQMIETTGRLALTGLEVGAVGTQNTPFWFKLQSRDQNIETVMQQVLVPTLKGPEPLARFANLSENERPTEIERERRSRKIAIIGALDHTRTFGNVIADVEKIVASIEKPFWGEVAGDKEFFQEMLDNFSLAFLGSMFFIFVILAIQFENLFRPFVILLSLPLALIGGLLALFFAGQQLAMGAIIGFILLIGLAAKNGILLVDAIGTAEKRLALRAAVLESVHERSRAILMTSIAMIFGMLPTALMRGAGSEFRSPMVVAIIGGVISSTLLSFIVVPAIFGLVERFRNRGASALTAGKRAIVSIVVVLAVAPASSEASALTIPKADMKEYLSLVRELPSVSSEATSMQAAQVGAEGARTASRLAFLGGARAEFGRELARPGLVQKATIPLPPQLGGPVSMEQVIVPKAQYVSTIAWQIPIINLQVFEGLKLTDELESQSTYVRDAKREQATLANAQLLIEYELAIQNVRVLEGSLALAEARHKAVVHKRLAGSARKLEEIESSVNIQHSVAELENARMTARTLRQRFKVTNNRELPEAGVGLPQYPFKGDAAFSSNGLKALEGAYKIALANIRVNDASFYPTLALELAHSRKQMFEKSAPDPQNIIALRAQWNILDGGARVRGEAQQLSAALDLRAQKEATERELQTSYAALAIRREGLTKQNEAASKAAQLAAEATVQSLNAYKAGLATANDLRLAEDAKLKAELAFLQTEFALQALALESLTLTNNWLPLLN